MPNSRKTQTTAVAVLLAMIVSLLGISPAAAQTETQRSLFVVGDSIVLGAQEEIVASAPAGWAARVDAKVSRGTDAGLDVVRANKASITDVLVIGLGANDGGSPGIFGPRVEALLAEVAHVPHVFWLEIAEVRPYYPGANAVVRDVASRYDNVSVIPWSALALSNPGLTADDGLHLTGPGQQAMADLVIEAAVATATYAEAVPPEVYVEADEIEPRPIFARSVLAAIDLLQRRLTALQAVGAPRFFR